MKSGLKEKLVNAIKGVCLDEVDGLVKHGADVNAEDVKGNSALMYASDAEIVNYLLYREAKVNEYIADTNEYIL